MGWSYRDIDPESFQPPLEPFAAFIHTLEDLAKKTVECVSRAFQEVIPYMEAVEARVVYPDLEMYNELSESPRERALRFSRENHDLPIRTDAATLDYLRDYMKSLMPCQEELYASRFPAVREQIIDLAAFAGEAVIAKFDGEWRWYRLGRRFPNIPDSFCIYLPDEGSEFGDFDPLLSIIMHWNFSSRLSGYGLNGGSIDDYFHMERKRK